MKRSGWIARVLLLGATAVALVLAGDAMAGDKKGKKEKKDKKNKKITEVDENGKVRKVVVDPTRPKKGTGESRSGVKGKGSKGNGSKSQARSRSRQRARKKSCKRSSGGKK